MIVRCVVLSEIKNDKGEYRYQYQFEATNDDYINLDITLDSPDEFCVGYEYSLDLVEH